MESGGAISKTVLCGKRNGCFSSSQTPHFSSGFPPPILIFFHCTIKCLPLLLPHEVYEFLTRTLYTTSLDNSFLPPTLTYLILITSLTHIIFCVFCLPYLAADTESRG